MNAPHGSAALVGIIGGSGEVGVTAARCLTSAGIPVRIGGRRADAIQSVAAAIGPRADARPVDVADTAALRGFAQGCRVVLNCVGPGELVAGPVRAAVTAAQADSVDVMTGKSNQTTLPGGRVAVMGAGLCPGLSGLLPGLLAAGLAAVDDFEGAYCGLGAFTESAAMDYLLSMRGGYGTSMAAWRNGRLATSALPVEEDYQLPQVPGSVTAHPYLSDELRERVAALHVTSARWYNAFDGEHLLAALTRLRRNDHPDLTELARAAKTVVRASALDAAGRTPYHLLYGRARGSTPHGPVIRSAIVRGADGSRITGAMAAVTVEAVLAGTVAPGAHAAAAVLDPKRTVNRLRELVPDLVLSITEQPAELAAAAVSDTTVEGEL